MCENRIFAPEAMIVVFSYEELRQLQLLNNEALGRVIGKRIRRVLDTRDRFSERDRFLDREIGA